MPKTNQSRQRLTQAKNALSKKAHRSRKAARQLLDRHKRSVALGLFAPAAFMSMQQSANAKTRGMYVWHTNEIITNTAGARAALFSFAKLPPGKSDITALPQSPAETNTLYFYAHSYIAGDATKAAQLRSFLREAHANGLSVHFLDGAPDWATTGKSYGEGYMDKFVAFQQGSAADEKFDGVLYDVEPYLNAGWFTQSIWDGFTSLITNCKNKLTAAGLSTPFGVAIPRWYESNPGPAYLYQIQQLTDYVAVMDYVDKASNLIADVSTEISNANALGKKVVVSVETIQMTPTSSSFYEEGWGNMEASLYEVDRAYANNPSFDGVAIHHYDTYQTITKLGTGGADLNAPRAISLQARTDIFAGVLDLTVVDIGGNGVDWAATIASATVTNIVNGVTNTVSGTWSAQSATVYRFTPFATLNGGDFKVALTAKDVSGNIRTDEVSTTALAVPLASLPVNGAKDVINSPTLQWSEVTGADQYHIQVSSDGTFATTIFDGNVTTTSKGLTGLSDTTTYYWRVEALKGTERSGYSTRSSFTTGGTAIIVTSDPGPIPITQTSKRKGKKA